MVNTSKRKINGSRPYPDILPGLNPLSWADRATSLQIERYPTGLLGTCHSIVNIIFLQMVSVNLVTP